MIVTSRRMQDLFSACDSGVNARQSSGDLCCFRASEPQSPPSCLWSISSRLNDRCHLLMFACQPWVLEFYCTQLCRPSIDTGCCPRWVTLPGLHAAAITSCWLFLRHRVRRWTLPLEKTTLHFFAFAFASGASRWVCPTLHPRGEASVFTLGGVW